MLYDHSQMLVKPCMTTIRKWCILASILTPVTGAAAGLVKPIRPIVTEGGLRGIVVRVTTLAANGPGSLADAIERREPRLVVFEVGGVIDLVGRTLVVKSPYLTIAGQTAPDPGITLIRGNLTVEAHDVVIQHIAVRPGDLSHSRTNWEPDALGARRG